MPKFELITVDEINHNNPTSDQNFEVADFAADVKRAARGIRTAVRDRDTSWVYRDGDPYVMGWVGYVSFTGRGKKAYGVYSPNITNNKYSGGIRTNMVFSEQRDKAVKNALKHLRPLSLNQTIAMSRDKCGYSASGMHRRVRESVDKASRTIAKGIFGTYQHYRKSPPPLQVELMHLVDSGYQFMNPEVGETLRTIFGGLRELAALDNKSSEYTVVIAVEHAGGTRFHIVPDHDVTGFLFNHTDPVPDNHVVYSQADLPEDIAGKLAVLSMVDADYYVEGVGYKASSRVYYLR